MTRAVGKFSKVSLSEYSRAIKYGFGEHTFSDDEIADQYNTIRLPKRSTKGSAGYDFYAPFYFYLPSWGDIVIPTGVRVEMADGWYLELYPRSGTGMRHYLRISNVPVIDADYYGNPTNEGHIMVKLRKESGQRDTSAPTSYVEFRAGDAYCQGIFHEFGITIDDMAAGERMGGFGSTGK